MLFCEQFSDYRILDASGGEKLEKWGDYILIRPDPQIIWNTPKIPMWQKADAHYFRSEKGGGTWDNNGLPASWNIRFGELNFILKPMSFKHVGLFPEQSVNWLWMADKIKKSGREINMLNLFAYTGGATLAAAGAGAKVCHVDASKGMTIAAKENAAISGLSSAPIRYIVDDCIKFVQREIKRGVRYDAVVLDPPSYGRGPSGEIWKLEDNIYGLLKLINQVLSDNPLFVILNSYTTGLSPATMGYLLGTTITKIKTPKITAEELGIKVESTGLMLPSGQTSRIES